MATRLVASNGKIPHEDSFAKAAEHLLKLSSDMRIAVFTARCVLGWEWRERERRRSVIIRV